MAKDDRLYARFDIGMDEHEKIMLLNDRVFRALIEATLYARRQLTDGFLAEGVVLKKWGGDVAPALTTNHPERPSWVRVEGGWQIHDFEEHQTTNADIEAKKAAGRKGGMAKARNMASKPIAPASEVLGQKASTTPSAPLAITDTDTETDTDTTPKGVVPRKRGTRIPEPFILTREMRSWAADRAPHVDVNLATEKFANHWRAKTRDATKLDWLATWHNWILSDYQKPAAGKQTKDERALSVIEQGRRIQEQRDRGAISA
jgi:hypothetical protein